MTPEDSSGKKPINIDNRTEMPFHCRDYQQVSTTIQLARKGQNFTQKGHQTMKLFYKCTGIKKKNGIDITELGQC